MAHPHQKFQQQYPQQQQNQQSSNLSNLFRPNGLNPQMQVQFNGQQQQWVDGNAGMLQNQMNPQQFQPQLNSMMMNQQQQPFGAMPANSAFPTNYMGGNPFANQPQFFNNFSGMPQHLPANMPNMSNVPNIQNIPNMMQQQQFMHNMNMNMNMQSMNIPIPNPNGFWNPQLQQQNLPPPVNNAFNSQQQNSAIPVNHVFNSQQQNSAIPVNHVFNSQQQNLALPVNHVFNSQQRPPPSLPNIPQFQNGQSTLPNNTSNPNSQVIRSSGLQRSQFHQRDNRKKKPGFSNEHKGKGQRNQKAANFSKFASADEGKKKERKITWAYTEKEIRQWCEARKKNHPSKNYMAEEKKAECDADSEKKLRCQQLKEILAKQAELGVEVAEIPPSYLLDTEKQGMRKNDRRRERKRHKGGKFNKKQQMDPSKNSQLAVKKPTLLEKLLSADIKKDKRRLLQVFRFVVMNSFFKEWPEKSLKFPTVVLEGECDVDVKPTMDVGVDGEEEDEDNDSNDDAQFDQKQKVPDRDEGEITDSD